MDNTKTNMKRVIVIVFITTSFFFEINALQYKINSPSNKVEINVSISNSIEYSVKYDEKTIIVPSKISMTLSSGLTLGISPRIKSVAKKTVKEKIEAPFYRQKVFDIEYNKLDILFKDKYGIRFYVYDEGFAYSFYTLLDGEIVVVDELAEFNFAEDYPLYAAYSTNTTDPFQMAFQNYYENHLISQINKTLPFLTPAAIDLGNQRKAIICEAGLESYPGMFLTASSNPNGIAAIFAQNPDSLIIHPIRCQPKVSKRGDYLAKTKGTRSFPWRVVLLSEKDEQLPVNNIVYSLAPHNRINDYSWIKPGKIAWDWWNNWGLTGVDFVAGINTQTYKYFIDFASTKGVEYVVLDEGWSEPAKGDILSNIPEINLQEIIKYANSKNVGIILWAVADVLDNKLEQAMQLYSTMGVKGFKVDFLDRDDQRAIDQTYRIVDAAARYKMIIDLHGANKPFGINRTYPNVLNIEGVFGLEELKWSNPNMPLYDVTMPFIRMSVGNVDYTQGAMKNANRKNFKDIYDNPMSQGTRAHQVAEYIIFDSPLVTMCDSPSAYMNDVSCTDFIVSIPTVFDKTVIVEGKMGEYIITARKSGEEWYLGGLTNWDARKIDLKLNFLEEGTFDAKIFRDGVNAHARGEDYIIEKVKVSSSDMLSIDMSSGGGVAIKFIKQ